MFAGATGGRLEQNHPVLQQRAGASSQQSVYTQTQGCTDEKRQTQTQLMHCVDLRDTEGPSTSSGYFTAWIVHLPLTEASFWEEIKKRIFLVLCKCFEKQLRQRAVSKELVFQSNVPQRYRFTDFALHFGLSVVCLLFKARLDLHVHFCCVYILCRFNWCDLFFYHW